MGYHLAGQMTAAIMLVLWKLSNGYRLFRSCTETARLKSMLLLPGNFQLVRKYRPGSGLHVYYSPLRPMARTY